VGTDTTAPVELNRKWQGLRGKCDGFSVFKSRCSLLLDHIPRRSVDKPIHPIRRCLGFVAESRDAATTTDVSSTPLGGCFHRFGDNRQLRLSAFTTVRLDRCGDVCLRHTSRSVAPVGDTRRARAIPLYRLRPLQTGQSVIRKERHRDEANDNVSPDLTAHSSHERPTLYLY
jgi:hypothetical protein